MNAVAFATRRLWVRRSRRAWIIFSKVAGVIAWMLPPMWFYWFYDKWVRSWKDTGSEMF